MTSKPAPMVGVIKSRLALTSMYRWGAGCWAPDESFTNIGQLLLAAGALGAKSGKMPRPMRSVRRMVMPICGSGDTFVWLQTLGNAPVLLASPSSVGSLAACWRVKQVCSRLKFDCTVTRVIWPARPAGL